LKTRAVIYKKPTNGWNFWKYKDNSGNLVKLINTGQNYDAN
jgi:hypothetical protein